MGLSRLRPHMPSQTCFDWQRSPHLEMPRCLQIIMLPSGICISIFSACPNVLWPARPSH